MAEKVSESEDSKVGSDERRGCERTRPDPEPSAAPKDPKQPELPSSRSAPKGEPFNHGEGFPHETKAVCVHSGALQRDGEASRKAQQRPPPGERGRAVQGEPARCGWRCRTIPPPSPFSFHTFPSAPADDAKSDDVPEGRLNGDRETLDEMDESRKEEKNGFKAKFMFNIADGGFTGKS